MKEFAKRQKIRKIVYSIPAIILVGALTFFLSKSTFEVFLKERESARTVKNLQENMEELTQRESELRDEIRRLGTEPGLEEEIRAKFNVADEGEYLVVIVDPKQEEIELSEIEIPWYKEWFSFIKNLLVQ